MNMNLPKPRGLKQEALRLISTVGLLALRWNKGRTKGLSTGAATRFPPSQFYRCVILSPIFHSSRAWWVILRVISSIHSTTLMEEVNFLAEDSQQQIHCWPAQSLTVGLKCNMWFIRSFNVRYFAHFSLNPEQKLFHLHVVAQKATEGIKHVQYFCLLRSKYAASWSSIEYLR